MKPTYGAVGRSGVFPLSFSLDHVGPLTRDVRSNAVVLEAILGRDPHDPASVAHPRPTLGARIGTGHQGASDRRARDLSRRRRPGDPRRSRRRHPHSRRRWARGSSRCGCRALDLYADCGRLILQAEGVLRSTGTGCETRPFDYSMRGRTRLLPGAFLERRRLHPGAAAADAADEGVHPGHRRRATPRSRVSSLEFPCAIDDEATIDRTYDRQARTPFNVTGTPALSLPVGFSRSRAADRHADPRKGLRRGDDLPGRVRLRDRRPPWRLRRPGPRSRPTRPRHDTHHHERRIPMHAAPAL